MAEHIRKATEYYRKIDEGDIDWVLSLFAKNGRYIRAEIVLDGHNEIEAFYSTVRKIRGMHTIELAIAQDHYVFVRGRFDGIGATQVKKNVSFCDFWSFNDDIKVSLRQTYLAWGAEYVRE